VANPITLSGRQVPNNLPAIQNIQGNNVMTGNITTGTGGTDYIIASEGGQLTMQGTFIPSATGARNLVLQGAGYGAFVGSIANGSATTALVKNGTGTWTLSNAKTYTGNTTINGGTLLLGAANAISATSNAILNGGTLATGGFAQNIPVPLNVSLNSTLDLGNGAGTVNFADSSGLGFWSGNLSVTHWTSGSDHLVFGNTNATLTSTQLSQITFATYSAPAIISATGEVMPGSLARILLKGDFSMNGVIDQTDIAEGLKALTNLSGFQANNSLDATQMLTVADVDSSGSVNNRDIQPLLNLVASFGLGSVAAVPEPSTMVLLALGGVALLATRYRKQRS
jgi:autotransporter-associated beta strand protein